MGPDVKPEVLIIIAVVAAFGLVVAILMRLI
jgi:hypothetical protein